MASFNPEGPLKKLGEGLAVAGGVALVLMMLHIVADVATKYLFNDPIDGTTEIVAAYYMVAVVFMPLAYVTFAEGHLIVELFTSRMSGRPLAALIGCAGLITLAYLLFLAWKIANAAAPSGGRATGSPMTFLQAAAFQWVNPKAWFMAFTAISVYAPSQSLPAIAIVAALFASVNFPSVSTWTLIGQQLRVLLTSQRRLAVFNWTMATLLVLSLVLIL